MYIDLPVNITISNLVPSELREIHSDSAKVKDFIITIHQHLASNNIYEKFDKYMGTIDNDLQPWNQSTQYNKNYIRKLSRQRKIGRDSIFYGFISKKILIQQTEYLKSMQEKNGKQQDKQAIQQITTTLLKFFHALWLTRNDHLHQTEINNAPSYKKLQLLQDIKELYQKRFHMLVDDRGIFSKTLISFDNKTTDQLQRFIQHSVPIIQKSIKDATHYGELFKRIAYYFPKPKPPPEPDPKNK